jgi:hypothetical protein
MRFTLYTQKTVPQCMSALNERLQAKATATRPELGGWIEKGGSFSLSVTSRVAKRFPRTTRLTGKAQRESGVTIVRGYVSEGISPQWLRVLFGVMLVVAVGLLLVDEPLLAVITFVFGGIAYIPLRGDYVNSDVLLLEVERTLKATPRPPKQAKK